MLHNWDTIHNLKTEMKPIVRVPIQTACNAHATHKILIIIMVMVKTHKKKL